MLFDRIFLDVVDPFLVPSLLIIEASVIIIETIVIFLLIERKIGKAFAASFVANLVTGLLSLFYLFLPVEAASSITSMLVLGLIINILLEAGILRLFYRGVNVRKILGVSVVMNVASYALIILQMPF